MSKAQLQITHLEWQESRGQWLLRFEGAYLAFHALVYALKQHKPYCVKWLFDEIGPDEGCWAITDDLLAIHSNQFSNLWEMLDQAEEPLPRDDIRYPWQLYELSMIDAKLNELEENRRARMALRRPASALDR